jgi:3-hydroxybutyryl-CoA dehydrogenase
MDLAGLATFHAIAAYLYRDLSAAQAPQPILGDKVARGEMGLRAGRGFYNYPPGSADAAIAARDAKLFALLKALDPPVPRESEPRPTER